MTDITEFKYGKDKKIYMCAALDIYDRSILSYSLSEKADTKLVLEVLRNSFNKNINHNSILHTDRGSQFTSLQYKKALKNLGITYSMSRADKCIDNGPMEKFFGTIKVEKYYLNRYEILEKLKNGPMEGFFGTIKVEKYYLNKYTTLDDLKNYIKEYIRFYDEEKLQKNLGNRSPLEYRQLKEKMSIIELST